METSKCHPRSRERITRRLLNSSLSIRASQFIRKVVQYTNNWSMFGVIHNLSFEDWLRGEGAPACDVIMRAMEIELQQVALSDPKMDESATFSDFVTLKYLRQSESNITSSAGVTASENRAAGESSSLKSRSSRQVVMTSSVSSKPSTSAPSSDLMYPIREATQLKESHA